MSTVLLVRLPEKLADALEQISGETRRSKKIGKSTAKDILGKIDTQLSKNSEKNPILKGKFSRLRKFHVGDYRIIYSIIETDTVLVLRIAH